MTKSSFNYPLQPEYIKIDGWVCLISDVVETPATLKVIESNFIKWPMRFGLWSALGDPDEGLLPYTKYCICSIDSTQQLCHKFCFYKMCFSGLFMISKGCVFEIPVVGGDGVLDSITSTSISLIKRKI